MNFLGTILLILILFSIGIYVIFDQLRLIYNRYLRTYKKEIIGYLEKRNYTLVDTISPKKNDWQRSPFKKPTNFQFSFFYTTPLIWSKTEYLKIIGCKGEKNQEFWLEIYTSYFHKPVLIFKDGHKINNIEKNITERDNIVLVKDKCPACCQKLLENENKCPECGLSFE